MLPYTFWQRYFLPDAPTAHWARKVLLSLIIPILFWAIAPIGLSRQQALVVGCVLLVIVWWSTNWVKKIPAALCLSLSFCLFSGTKLTTIFSFPLSETFPLIVMTYLFSQAITNSGLMEKLIHPLLLRWIRTSYGCTAAIIAIFYLTMFVIPQPLARLIIVASIFQKFFEDTHLPARTRSALLYAIFLFYAAVNMSAKDADMIMNYVAAGFSPVPISNGQWMVAMALPSFATILALTGIFFLLFRKELQAGRLTPPEGSMGTQLTRQQKKEGAVILGTVILWMTAPFHGIDSTLITLGALCLLFAMGTLHKKDFRSIDGTTLIFLTAAFSIGGVLKECGAADKIFGLFGGIFPAAFSPVYLLLMLLVTMALHLILGSNTTTLSVVVPGLIILCGNVVPSPVIVYIAIVAVSFHAILPFHSVAMMIGETEGHFPASYITRMAIPLTLLVYLSAVVIYLPWWRWIGLL